MTQRRTPFAVAGWCCILFPSLGMLAATFYNRSGHPMSTLTLTERELRLPTDDAASGDSSALTFGLTWRVVGMGHSDIGMQQPSATPLRWMTTDKCAELGVRSVADLRWRSSVPAFLVLEFNGSAYAHELEQACRNAESGVCARVRDLESRLYVVDAGADAQVLRQEYPDASAYAIVPGVMTFAAVAEEGPLTVTVSGLDVETIQAIEPLRSGRTRPSGEMSWHVLAKEKAFVAQIAFGHRHEPWNQAVSFGPHSILPPTNSPVYREDSQVEINPD